MNNKFTRFLWATLWSKWLDGDKVVKVKGWRTAIVDGRGNRRTISPCFLWFK
jgi:hypothetical protein